MSDDRFFERLRQDSRSLRHEPDEVTLARIRARIHEAIDTRAARPTVAALLAGWLRPLAAAAALVVAAAGIGLATTNSTATPTVTYSSVEISFAGDTYLVGN